MIKRSSELLGQLDAGVPPELLRSCLQEHMRGLGRLEKLCNYYAGEHAILTRQVDTKGAPNNRIVCNHAKYITDMATGYLLGDAIKYTSKTQELDELMDRYKKADIPYIDAELCKDASIFGRAVELVYMSDDEKPTTKSAFLDPRTAFMVYGDDVEARKLFGVYYYETYNTSGTLDGYWVHAYTERKRFSYRFRSLNDMPLSAVDALDHNMGGIPMIEYRNNEEETGDAEPIMSLIDAYNLLQSDRVNDVERFVQAILFIKGFDLDDDEAKRLREQRMIVAKNADSGADACWLVNALNQGDVETVRKNLEADIHKFSMVPALTDENFAGQASGVAMRYKLLGFDQMIKIKERYMEKGLRQRLKLYLSAANWQNSIDPEAIDIQFTHSLPVNELEIAQMVSTLDGMVPMETLLSQLPFVVDPAEAAEAMRQEKEEAAKRQRTTFDVPLADQEE